MAGRRIGYIRVSSLDQNTQRQFEGIELDRILTDKASGKDTKRPSSRSSCASSGTATPFSCTAWTGSPGTWTTSGRWCNG
jgi:hypothetical protein